MSATLLKFPKPERRSILWYAQHEPERVTAADVVQVLDAGWDSDNQRQEELLERLERLEHATARLSARVDDLFALVESLARQACGDRHLAGQT